MLDIVKRGRKRKASANNDTVVKNNKKESPAAADQIKSKEAETESGAGTDQKPTVEASSSTSTKEKPAKKPKKPLPEGYNSGVYTELEEKHFLEGLEKFGRDWGEVKLKRW